MDLSPVPSSENGLRGPRVAPADGPFALPRVPPRGMSDSCVFVSSVPSCFNSLGQITGRPLIPDRTCCLMPKQVSRSSVRNELGPAVWS